MRRQSEDHNARVQQWLEVLTAFDCTLEYRTGNANGSVNLLSRLPEPVTESDRSGSSSLTPMDDDSVFLIRAFELRTPFLTSPRWLGWAGAPAR